MKWIHSVAMAAKRTPEEELFTPLSDQEIVDEFWGYLYHLDGMEDPFQPDYPPSLRDKTGPRDLLRIVSFKPNCISTTIAKSKPAISWIEPVLESNFEALEHLFLMSLMSVNWPHRVTSQFLRGPSISTINSSTNPSLSGYFSRRCCLQVSAVCFCRFLVPRPIGDSSWRWFCRDVSIQAALRSRPARCNWATAVQPA